MKSISRKKRWKLIRDKSSEKQKITVIRVLFIKWLKLVADITHALIGSERDKSRALRFRNDHGPIKDYTN